MLTSKPLLIFSVTLSLNTPLPAQIFTDGTLGLETSLTGPNVEIPADLGQQHGSNLFHSFKEFNINTDETATFTGPDTVQNILTRVTGGDLSRIDGTLRSDIPNANLYLLNPNGIVFGENAKLDISGSFHASTADVLHLKDGGHFDALTPDQSQLTVAPPEAFGFLRSSPAAISIQGNQSKLAVLEVGSEQTLSLIGGALTIQDSILHAPSGRINLVSLASAGTVFQTADNLAITALGGQIHLSQSNYEPLMMSGLANLDVSGREDGTGLGGRVVIRAGQLFLDQGRIFADTYFGIGGGIDIDVGGKISLENGAEITANNLCQRDCEGTQGGDITVRTSLLSFRGWSEKYRSFLYETYLREDEQSPPEGYTPEEIEFYARHDAYLDSMSSINANNLSPEGRGGNISISAIVLEMTPGNIQTATYNSGDAGNIQINDNQQFILKDGGNLHAVTLGPGQAGKITIHSQEVSLSTSKDLEVPLYSSFISVSAADSSGPAGNIELTTQHLNLEDAWITGFNSGTGPGGDIMLDVSGNLWLNRSHISTSAEGGQPENSGGNITIGHPNLLVLENSGLFAKANTGKGGTIKVQANHFIHSYPFEEKEYSTELDHLTFKEKISQGFTLIDASSKKGLPGEVRMETKEWTFADLQPFPSPLPKLQLTLSRCASFSKDNLSRFLITARDILPRSPEDLRTHTIDDRGF